MDNLPVTTGLEIRKADGPREVWCRKCNRQVDFFEVETPLQEVPDDRLTMAVREVFPLSPLGIIEYLDLLRPIYKKTAAFGHFGRDEPEFTWERTDRTADIRTACGV